MKPIPDELILPDVFFDAVAHFLPGLNEVALQCGISIGEWIILWHLRRAGVPNDKKQPTMPRQGLTELLARRGFGDANISRLLNSLENKEFIRRTSLTAKEREQLFGVSLGSNRQVVILQPFGERKIGDFQQRLTDIFASWISKQPMMTRRALLSASGIGQQIAERLSKGKRSKPKGPYSMNEES
jgi:DNA-binding MarR family transcriptional regulator